MKEPCLDKNLRNNSGTSQQQRSLAALAEAYAHVDERKISDLILFAKKYGAYLNYYNLNNSAAGNWQGFMSVDIAVSIASAATINSTDCFNYVNNTLYPYIRSPAATPPYSSVSQTFKYIFDLVASLAYLMNQALLNVPADADYYTFLSVSIGSKLATPLWLLQDYYMNFLNKNFPAGFPLTMALDSASPAGNIAYMSSLNFLSASPWRISTPPSVANPNPLDSISFNPASPEAYYQIISSSIFKGTVNSFLNGIAFIVNQTNSIYLPEIISTDNNHTPHYALYLAFLKLFRSAEQHLNEYTGRHLRFYYEKVLQLKPASGVSDIVFTAFTLQKTTPQHLLPKATQLSAGKDANGNPLFYALTNDIVLNQASVSALHAIYLSKVAAPPLTPPANQVSNGIETLYSSAIANSADGAGAAITAPDGSWLPFGDLTNPVFTANLPNIGFAIASNLLYLNEGLRTITLAFNCKLQALTPQPVINALNALTGQTLINSFLIQCTGNKSWFPVNEFEGFNPSNTTEGNTALLTSTGTDTYTLVFTLYITGSAPPMVAYSQKIHGGNFPQALPMLQATLTDFTSYAELKALTITSVNVQVEVSNMKNLALMNCDGKIDTSKPFKPFGAFPPTDGSFIIGSKEIFQKPLTSVTLNFSGLEFPNYNVTSVNVSPCLLSSGSWTTPGATDTLANTLTLDNSILPSAAMIGNPDFTPNESYSASSQNGFINLTLAASTDLSLYTYLKNSAPNPTVTVTQVISQEGQLINNLKSQLNSLLADSTISTRINADATLQSGVSTINNNLTQLGTVPLNTQYNITSSPLLPPPSPTVNSLTIDYIASETITLNQSVTAPGLAVTFSKRTQFFYHLEPFGFREMHPFLFTIPAETDTSLPDNKINALPVFNIDNDTLSASDKGTVISPDNGGELWIGLAGAVPGETHSILFEVSEGSSNPLKPVTKIDWYYLSSNNWISLDNTVVDYTNALSESGLVIFPLPGDETLNNTRADSGLVWVKVVATSNPDAICKIISITTNAAEAKLVQDIPNNIQFSGNIAANTISKLAVADGTVKQVTQPYPSFGGKLPENTARFDQRISERLRHKNRAVTAWDYERLVLQNFQQIHKVKCINHTNLSSKEYCELKPGHVLVVTIPDLSNLPGANKYLPFTDVGLLNDILVFLKPHTSPFVDLKVMNPQFEGVQFQFDVTFQKGLDENFYKGQLNTDIMNFLMPWASGSYTQDIEFGGTIEKSAVLNFVQQCPYVDFVTCFVMNQYIYTENEFTLYKNDIEEAVATTARSILVPYYAPGINPTGNLITSPANCNC